MPASVTCIVKTFPQAEAIATRLQRSGLSSCKVSVPSVCAQKPKRIAVEEATAKVSEGIVMGAGAFGLSGGILGYMAGMGDLALPAFSFFEQVGPAVSTLSGIALGISFGGILGALLGRKVPQPEVEWTDTEQTMREYLLSVSIRDRKEETRAKQIIQGLGGEDVATRTEGTSPG